MGSGPHLSDGKKIVRLGWCLPAFILKEIPLSLLVDSRLRTFVLVSLWRSDIMNHTPTVLSGPLHQGGPGPQVHIWEQSVGWILARRLILLCF